VASLIRFTPRRLRLINSPADRAAEDAVARARPNAIGAADGFSLFIAAEIRIISNDEKANLLDSEQRQGEFDQTALV